MTNRDQAYYEKCQYLRDLIHHDSNTKELMETLYVILETEVGEVLYRLGRGMNDETDNPLSHAEYAQLSGLVAGLEYLKVRVDSMISFANRRDGEKNTKE